jgi:hypothetical protein
MGEPYYRITVAQSELEGLLYETKELGNRLSNEERVLTQRGENDGVPRVASISVTHRNFFRTRFYPCIICASQLILHTNTTNRRFSVEYGGEYMSRAYQIIDIGAGTVVFNPVMGTAAAWAYCKNFLASFLNIQSFKASTDTLYEYTGEMFFVLYSYLTSMAQLPALTRMIRETCFEYIWAPGAAATDGATSGQLAVHFPYAPPQAYAATHAAMTLYLPLTLFGLNSVENAYPIVAVYSLPRWVEYTFNTLENCVNLYFTTTLSGNLIAPSFAGNTIVTWTSVPAVTDTRLMVEYWVVHKSLQRMLAMNPHGILFHQYTKLPETIVDKNSMDIAVTKIIETIYILCVHYYNTMHTQVGVTVLTMDDLVTTAPILYPIDPFRLPMGQKPINRITVSARGQNFFRDHDWEEITSVFPYMYGQSSLGTTLNACVGIITFGVWYWGLLHTSSYNNGYGPNLKLAWLTHVFSSADPGVLIIILQTINMVLAYRGGITVRYT